MLGNGTVSAAEVLDAHLVRIDEVNPVLNAIVTETRELAASMAAEADRRQAAGEQLGLLHGLPIAHKDLADTAGVLTTRGSPIFADNVPTENAPIVERAQSAGAVMVGKSNTPEFGMGSQTFNQVFGTTCNPYDISKTPGGSSGGAAVALAAAMVPIADGSDLGGSLRNPAAFCNVVGFRPSPGRVPNTRTATPWVPLATEGPMARTVDDVALLLAAQAGPELRAAAALETPGTAFLPPVPVPDRPLRVAWAPNLDNLPIDAAVSDVLASAPGVFAELGHHVEEAAPDLSNAREIFDILRAWLFAMSAGPLYDEHKDKLKDTAIWQIERGLNLPMADHQRASRQHAALYQRTVDFFEDYDVLLCPVTQVAPFSHETEYITEINGQKFDSYIEWMRVCTDVTLMNCPAISVPAGFTDDGLPIGLQIVGPPRRDSLVLQVAKHYETATNFGQQRPVL